VALAGIVAILACYGANQLGWWWVTLLAGFALGLLVRGPSGLAAAVVVPLLAWGGDLLLHPHGLMETARITASLAGLGAGNGWMVVLLTVGFGVCLGLAGYWLGVAVRRVATAPAPMPGPPPSNAAVDETEPFAQVSKNEVEEGVGR
jgi:hypothetical protein